MMNENMSHQAGSGDGSDVSFDHLYRAILQCFVIILSGYVAGRAGLVTSSQSAGIGTFVAKFCLPALLFKSMCELNFSQVNWMFLVGILVAKTFVFIFVGLVTLLVKRPLNLGYAGIFSIFATQSNDFALGYPIVEALYGKTHPNYQEYLYLIAPISLVLLNPIGFTLMEIHKHRSMQDERRGSIRQACLHVLKGVVLNPIVFMTVIGVLGNIIFSGSVPAVIDDVLVMLGNAYNASALFYLGLSMVGKIKSQLGLSIVVPVLLIAAKNILLPLVTWEVVDLLETGNESTSYSMYAFLYGTFPSAPSVFLYASDYGIAQNVIATGLVLGTFLSAPLMFVSAKMVTLIVVSGADYRNLLSSTSFDISILSIICCLWVIGVFLVSGKWRRIPHAFTLALMCSHILACLGMIAFYFYGETRGWQHYLILIILLVGVLSTRCWTAVIAVVLCLLYTRSLCYVLRKQVWFYFFGFGVPVFTTGILFLLGSHEINGEIDPSFHYGSLQTSVSLVVVSLSLVITITSLVWWQRLDWQVTHQERGAGQQCARDVTTINESDRKLLAATPEHPPACESAGWKKAPSIEDLVPFSSPDVESDSADIMQAVSERTCLLGQCSTKEKDACRDRLRVYAANVIISGEGLMESEVTPSSDKEMCKEEYQTVHHLILLLLLILSMSIGMFLCAWRVFNNQPTGIYVEIEFLDCVFNYGQGFLILMVFGFDTRLVFTPLVRRLRRYLFGADVVHLPNLSDLDPETKQTCQQFTDYHKEKCTEEIVRDRRFQSRTYKNVFTGTSLCDWLLRAGLVTERDEAVAYGRRLLLGRVITHTKSQEHFQDAPYFYQFLDTFEYMAC